MRDRRAEAGERRDDVVTTDRRRDRRAFVVVVTVLVLLLGAVYAGGWALTSDRLPRGATVADVRVGGLTAREARREVAEATADLAVAPIPVVADGRTFTVLPAEVGLEVDVSGSVGQVPVGRTWDPVEMWRSLFHGDDVALLTVAVGDGVERRVAAIARAVDEPVVEGGVRFTPGGNTVAVQPRAGRTLDQAAAVAALVEAYPATGAPVVLASSPVTPGISAEEVDRALRRVADPAVSGPVTYVVGRRPVVLRPVDVAAALRLVPVGGSLRPRLDVDALWSRFAPVTDRLARLPEGSFVRVADRVLPPAAAADHLRAVVGEGLLEVLSRDRGERRVAVPLVVVRRGDGTVPPLGP